MKDKILNALTEAQRRYSDKTLAPKAKHRGTVCTVDECERPAWSRGMCNAHYLRNRKGGDMDTPIKHRSGGKTCRTCKTPLDSHAGWGFCRNHYRQERRKVIKKALVEAMGGCCSICGDTFHSCVFDFHHLGDKDAEISTLLGDGSSLNTLIQEADKCVLMCANCHRIEHQGESDERI